MSVTSIWDDKRAHSRWNGWYCLGCLSHSTKGGRKGKQGRWSYVPHKGTGWACQQPSLSRMPKKPLLPTLFWPGQETLDLSLEMYFHGRTKAVCPDTGEPAPCLGAGPWGVSDPRGPGCPSGRPSLATAARGLQGFTMKLRCQSSLPLSPAPFHSITSPALRSPHWND